MEEKDDSDAARRGSRRWERRQGVGDGLQFKNKTKVREDHRNKSQIPLFTSLTSPSLSFRPLPRPLPSRPTLAEYSPHLLDSPAGPFNAHVNYIHIIFFPTQTNLTVAYQRINPQASGLSWLLCSLGYPRLSPRAGQRVAPIELEVTHGRDSIILQLDQELQSR